MASAPEEQVAIFAKQTHTVGKHYGHAAMTIFQQLCVSTALQGVSYASVWMRMLPEQCLESKARRHGQIATWGGRLVDLQPDI